MLKLAVVAPARTVTLGGMLTAAVFPFTSDTRAPPAGAAPDNVTVPSAVAPPPTLAGVSAKLWTLGRGSATAGVTVTVAVLVSPL
jgi:hypothetical protein